MSLAATLRRALCAIGIAAALPGCAEHAATASAFPDALVAAYEKSAPAAQPIRIADHTDFAWDALQVFPPYSSEERISRALGGQLPGSVRETRIFERDDINVLAFLKAGAVVAVVALDRGRLDISMPPQAPALSPASAVFVPSVAPRRLTLATTTDR